MSQTYSNKVVVQRPRPGELPTILNSKPSGKLILRHKPRNVRSSSYFNGVNNAIANDYSSHLPSRFCSDIINISPRYNFNLSQTSVIHQLYVLMSHKHYSPPHIRICYKTFQGHIKILNFILNLIISGHVKIILL